MNPDTVHYLNVFLGFGAICLQIVSVITLGMLFFGPKKNSYLDFVNKHYLPLGFAISLSAVLFSLVYSEIIKFAPCYLCWWARVFMVPQAFLYGLALWNKDRKVLNYSALLIAVGFVVSVYHNLGYYFGEGSSLPCDASGISCYQHLVSEFGGYISIPMLSLTSVVGIATLVAVAHFYGKRD